MFSNIQQPQKLNYNFIKVHACCFPKGSLKWYASTSKRLKQHNMSTTDSTKYVRLIFFQFHSVPLEVLNWHASPLTNPLNTIRLHSASLSHTLYILSLSSASGFYDHGPEQRRVYRQEWPEGYVRSFRWTSNLCYTSLSFCTGGWSSLWPLTSASAGRLNVKQEELDQMLQEAAGPINFTVFLTMFGEKLKGKWWGEVVRI